MNDIQSYNGKEKSIEPLIQLTIDSKNDDKPKIEEDN